MSDADRPRAHDISEETLRARIRDSCRRGEHAWSIWEDLLNLGSPSPALWSANDLCTKLFGPQHVLWSYSMLFHRECFWCRQIQSKLTALTTEGDEVLSVTL